MKHQNNSIDIFCYFERMDYRHWTNYRWLSPKGKPPLDDPECGYSNENCEYASSSGMLDLKSIFIAVISEIFLIIHT